jgi:ERO1-like protein beta
VFVNLVANPERFTGYAGDHARAIWREIYRENCFELQPQDEEEEVVAAKYQLSQSSAITALEAVLLGRPKGRLNEDSDREIDPSRLQNTCLEKRVFWRLISGMHTSISTHLCWDHLNQTTGEWVSHHSSSQDVN